MSVVVSKSERRREQNRRAQANLRKRHQQKVDFLEQELIWLRSQSQPQEFAGGGIPIQTIQPPSLEMVSTQACPGFVQTPLSLIEGGAYSNQAIEGSYDSIQSISTDIPNYAFDETALVNTASTTFPEVLAPYNHQLVTPAQLSSITPTPADVSVTSGRITSEAQCEPVQYHCAFDALTRNATLLKITPESFLSTHSNSPFYSPLQCIDSIAASVAHLPPEFQPTMAQLSYPHQPWIDCVPLQDFRSRIIFAVSHRPPFLDSLDLFHDVLSDGLSCGTDPRNAALWTMSDDFMNRWQMLLTLDLESLQKMCLTSNPPVRVMNLPNSPHAQCDRIEEV